jgi:predicted O-linked N-acetylglucosamine transferase (SPINDLY family)
MHMSIVATAPIVHNAGHPHWQHGLALADRRDWRAAARLFGRATRASRDDSVYWLNLAHAQRAAGLLTRAVAAARRALRLDPSEPLALRILGDCFVQLHRYADAVSAFEALQSLQSQDTAADGQPEPDAMLQHASALQALGRQGEAATVLLRVLQAQPAHVKAWALLSDCCRDRGLKQEAVEAMKTVLALEPDNLEARVRVSFEKRHVFDWADLGEDTAHIERLLAAMPADARRVSASFAMLSLDIAPELHRAAAAAESRALCAGVMPLPPVLPACRAGKKPVLGFVSYDLREHPVSQLLIEVLEGLDRSRFALHLYSSGPDDGSALRARLRAAADAFIDLRGLSDAQAAERIRTDGVDVLVDLMGHTRGMRQPIFAHRPAPVQVGFLGCPATSGANFIDYIVGDPLVTPLELAHQFSEKIAQLPLTLQPNGRGVRPLPQPMSRAEAGLPEGAFVMCAFNHTYKILPPAFDAWCAVMHELPHVVLWLKETNAQLHANARRAAAERGIDPARVIFAPGLPWQKHFSRLALADVFVDTWPYNAHTTAADALWAGVPVVTLYGNAYASRVAASVLNAAGIAELAFDSVDAYRLAILALATEPGLLAGYREHLTQRRLELPLFDTPRYTRELEALFERMVQRWRAGLLPEHLSAK